MTACIHEPQEGIIWQYSLCQFTNLFSCYVEQHQEQIQNGLHTHAARITLVEIGGQPILEYKKD